LQFIRDRLRRSCIDSVAIVNAWRHESMHESCCRSIIERSPDATKLSKPVEASCAGPWRGEMVCVWLNMIRDADALVTLGHDFYTAYCRKLFFLCVVIVHNVYECWTNNVYLSTAMQRCWKLWRSAVKYVTVSGSCPSFKASASVTSRWRFVPSLQSWWYCYGKLCKHRATSLFDLTSVKPTWLKSLHFGLSTYLDQSSTILKSRTYLDQSMYLAVQLLVFICALLSSCDVTLKMQMLCQ